MNSDIAKRRKNRDYNDYVVNFDYLTIKACKYAKDNELLADKWKELCNFSVEKGGRICYPIDKPTEDVEVEPDDGENWIKLLVERLEPNLMILQSWLRGHTESGSAREIAPSFEKGVTLLLNLCGYHALHVGDKYEVAAEKGRKEAGKASPGIDIFALSPDEREVLLVQCTTEWNDQSIKQKLSNISAITVELRAGFSAMENSTELYSSVVASVSRDTLPLGIGMPKQVKIVDVNDLQTLLCDVRNGIQPYELAKKIFT